jgi:cysteine-rich repeat protein
VNCTFGFCGDGIILYDDNLLEFCDDGNQNDFDDCTNDCRLPRCGDGIVSNQGNQD